MTAAAAAGDSGLAYTGDRAVAYRHGAAGEALPEHLADDPANRAAHHEGRLHRKLARRKDSPASSHPLTSSRRPASTPAAPAGGKRPARTRPARTSPRAGRGYLSRAFSPSAALRRVGGGKVAAAGDAGGLLLALVLYPMLLSTVKYGAAGPGIWFRAKWLNEAYTPGGIKEAQKRQRFSAGQYAYTNRNNYVDGDGYRYPHGLLHSKYRIDTNGNKQANPYYGQGTSAGQNGDPFQPAPKHPAKTGTHV